MTSPLPPWDPDEYDRRIKAERRQRDKEYREDHRHANRSDRVSTVNYTRGVGRGPASPAELERRKQAERTMRQREEQ